MAEAPVVRINPRRIERASIARAAGIISRGGVVAYPTETVYGLGADALNPRGVKRVFRIKGRSPDKPLIVLVRNRRELRTLVKEIPPPARRLMDRFWPGGLTLIFEASERAPKEILGGGTSIAVRISSSRISRALLKEARVPLTSSSANLAGQAHPTTAEEVARALGSRLDLIVDGGKSPQEVPSTILDVRQEPARLLRSGRIDVQKIRGEVEVGELSADAPAASSPILLVCAGNTCRSAMAAGILEMLLREKGGVDIPVRSAGTHAIDGQQASKWALQVALSQDGIDLSGHRSRRMTKGLIEEAGLILTMSLSQAAAVERLDKNYARKTHLLTAYMSTAHRHADDIQDPMGQGRAAYLRSYRLIKRELERILPALIKASQGRPC